MSAAAELRAVLVEAVRGGEEFREERVKIVSRFDRGDRQPNDLKQTPEKGHIHAESVVRVPPCDESVGEVIVSQAVQREGGCDDAEVLQHVDVLFAAATPRFTQLGAGDLDVFCA